MMMSGTSFSAGSFFSLLQTENPFMRGNSIDNRIKSGLSDAAAMSPAYPSSTTCAASPRRLSSVLSSPANAGSLSKTSTLVGMEDGGSRYRGQGILSGFWARDEYFAFRHVPRLVPGA